MLLDNFYTLLSSESPDSITWTIRVELNPEHAIYQGHFPEHPVVPGVCLLQLIKECTEGIRWQKLQYTQVSSCKFLSVVNPVKTPCLSITLTFKDMEEGKLQLQAEGTAKMEGTAKNECFIKLKAVLTSTKA
ncbi:hotdog family protein [Bacteroides congonensis]|uniref:3-hydroxylacyl-ACP dehydratase n=1 Tax=Bacteroides congonensis TaxID=1871006 RepID=UPI0018A11830|nr:3-hydroxylacyl-ACP dehydratase [Bacteroides congonensis]